MKINTKYLKLEEKLARTMLLETNQVFESDPKTKGIRYMWKLLGDLKYANTAGIDIEDHINCSLYKKALDELVAQNANDATYQMFEKRFVKYNQ